MTLGTTAVASVECNLLVRIDRAHFSHSIDGACELIIPASNRRCGRLQLMSALPPKAYGFAVRSDRDFNLTGDRQALAVEADDASAFSTML